MKLVWPCPATAIPWARRATRPSTLLGASRARGRQSLRRAGEERHRQAARRRGRRGAKLDAAARKTFADAAYARLDALYKTNEALRCIIFTPRADDPRQPARGFLLGHVLRFLAAGLRAARTKKIAWLRPVSTEGGLSMIELYTWGTPNGPEDSDHAGGDRAAV